MTRPVLLTGVFLGLGTFGLRSKSAEANAVALDTFAATAEQEFGVGQFIYVKGTYAQKGEFAICENGHPICEFSRDVKVGDMFDPTALINWTQDVPEVGGPNPPRSICGARWAKWPYMHFADGWRIARL